MDVISQSKAPAGNGTWTKEKICNHCRGKVTVTEARLQIDAQGNHAYCPHCRRVVRMSDNEVPPAVQKSVRVRCLSEEKFRARQPLKLNFH